MKKFKKFNCPICDKELINLSLEENEFDFWCDDCNIDISVVVNEPYKISYEEIGG